MKQYKRLQKNKKLSPLNYNIFSPEDLPTTPIKNQVNKVLEAPNSSTGWMGHLNKDGSKMYVDPKKWRGHLNRDGSKMYI